jgi:peroxiredoxin
MRNPILAALTFSLLVSLAAAQAAPERTADLGQPAPAFTLMDLAGKPHTLADAQGRVVVLEWTNHVCPAVAGWHEGRRVADAQAALDPARTAWWRIDSSWFGPAMNADIAAWQARLGLAGPLLLDPDGAVARSYGAEATPQFFVIDAAGVLRYVGALDEDREEGERVNHVVAAVEALLAGREVPRGRTRASGCTLNLGEPRAAVSARDVEREIDEDARAHALYAEAVALARSGKTADALTKLEQACSDDLPRPWRAVADPAFRPLLADAAARKRMAALLEARPARGELCMVAPDEPGTPFVLAGTVRDEEGEPIAGAVIALYHTDAAGWYSRARSRATTRASSAA